MKKENLDFLEGFYQPLSSIKPVEVIPTGIVSFDVTTGVGGLPRGRIIEIAGKANVGKSTLVLNITKNIQEKGNEVAWISIGEGLDVKYARTIGLNEDTPIIPVSSGEDFVEKFKLMLAYNYFDLIAVDSLQALSTILAQERETTVRKMNEKLSLAQLMSQLFTDGSGGFQVSDPNTGKIIKSNVKIPSIVNGKRVIVDDVHSFEQKKTCIIIISRLQEDTSATWGVKTYTGGGKIKDFSFSLRYEIRKGEKKLHTEDGRNILDYRVAKVICTKNKVGIPFKECNLVLWKDGLITETVEERLDTIPEKKKRGRKKKILDDGFSNEETEE